MFSHLPAVAVDFTGVRFLFPSDCRTPLGRGRAWLRLALMQKKLSDYMKTIINRKDLLRCV